MNKKALSPLMATIILIAFSIGLGAIVMTWGQSYIEENAQFVQGSGECDTVTYDIYEENVCIRDNQVEFYLENGETDLTGLKMAIIGTDGVKNVDKKINIKSGNTELIKVPYDNIGAVKQVKIIPEIKSGICNAKSTVKPVVVC